MKKNNLPLTNASIKEIYYEGQTQNIYQVPIYQRNYAWEDTEINALVKDVFDSSIVITPSFDTLRETCVPNFLGILQIKYSLFASTTWSNLQNPFLMDK